MVEKRETPDRVIKGGTKKKYTPPKIEEVWNEEIGMSGVYLLEM